MKQKVRVHTKENVEVTNNLATTFDWVATKVFKGQTIEVMAMSDQYGYEKGTFITAVIIDIIDKIVRGRRRVELKFSRNVIIYGQYKNLKFPRNPVRYLPDNPENNFTVN